MGTALCYSQLYSNGSHYRHTQDKCHHWIMPFPRFFSPGSCHFTELTRLAECFRFWNNHSTERSTTNNRNSSQILRFSGRVVKREALLSFTTLLSYHITAPFQSVSQSVSQCILQLSFRSAKFPHGIEPLVGTPGQILISLELCCF
jgi:hypothetical protein